MKNQSLLVELKLRSCGFLNTFCVNLEDRSGGALG